MSFEIVKKYIDIFARSLHMKITLLTCGLVFFSVMFVGGINYFRTIDMTLNKSVEGLAGETRLISSRFKSKYDEMKNDSFVISRTPPVQGIIRGINSGGFDKFDNSSIQSWKKRFAMIFSSVMKGRPHYMQIRFIGLADDGKELVRVNRSEKGIEVVAESQLQKKGQEPYFLKMIEGKKRKIFFSKVEYNKEYGKIDPRKILVIRSILPIFDGDELFGALVINADYDMMLSHTFEEIRPNKNAFIINDSGGHMEYYKDKGTADLKFHNDDDFPEFISSFHKSKKQEEFLIDKDKVFYGVKLNVDETDKTRFLGVVLDKPRSEIMQEVYQVRNQNIALGVLALFGSLFVAFFVTTRFTRPLREMTKEIISSRKNKSLYLPIHLKDEIGELARAFKEKSESLLESEEKMRTIMNNIIDGIITIDKNGAIESYSDVCRSIFGYEKEEVLGKNLSMLFKNKGLLGAKIKGLDGKSSEFVGLKKSGSEFPLEISANKIVHGDRELLCLAARDITARKQIENMKNEFISTVNHEIRTPLTSIQGSISLLKIKLSKKIDEKEQKLLEISYKNCERLAFLVNDILDVEKIAAGKMDYNLQKAEICEAVKNTVERNVGYAKKYDVTFKIEDNIKEAYCKIDVNRFGQAFTNLLSNAAKFSPQGGEVLILIERHGQTKVKISVCDKGIGIPKSFRSKIFQRFAQADGSNTRKKGGTGLGLSIAKSIIEAFGGRMDFESEENVGTKFYIKLPIVK